MPWPLSSIPCACDMGALVEGVRVGQRMCSQTKADSSPDSPTDQGKATRSPCGPLPYSLKSPVEGTHMCGDACQGHLQGLGWPFPLRKQEVRVRTPLISPLGDPGLMSGLPRETTHPRVDRLGPWSPRFKHTLRLWLGWSRRGAGESRWGMFSRCGT